MPKGKRATHGLCVLLPSSFMQQKARKREEIAEMPRLITEVEGSVCACHAACHAVLFSHIDVIYR